MRVFNWARAQAFPHLFGSLGAAVGSTEAGRPRWWVFSRYHYCYSDCPQRNVNLDLSHDALQDRLLLLVHQGAQVQAWWLTRRITLPWVHTWLARLNEVALPQWSVPALNAPRNLATEHALALEFDGPTRRPCLPLLATPAGSLLSEVTLSVGSTGTQLQLMSTEGQRLLLDLTRKESHACLELLARRCRRAGWCNGVAADWPQWLGAVGKQGIT